MAHAEVDWATRVMRNESHWKPQTNDPMIASSMPYCYATVPPMFQMQTIYLKFCSNIVQQTCHFLTMDRNLSVVVSMPWKLVSTLRPCTSSDTSLNLRNATSSFCRSASDTSKTRPFSASDAISAKTHHALHYVTHQFFIMAYSKKTSRNHYGGVTMSGYE